MKKQQKRAQKTKVLTQQPKPKLLVAMMCERKKHHLLTKTGMAEGRERDKSIGVSNKEAEVDEVEKSIGIAKKMTTATVDNSRVMIQVPECTSDHFCL